MNGRKVLRSILGGFVIVSLLAVSGCGLTAENDQLKKENTGLNQQVKNLTTESEDLKSKITAITTENESLKKENEALKAKSVPPKKGASKKSKKTI